jgi:hypothetical protein
MLLRVLMVVHSLGVGLLLLLDERSKPEGPLWLMVKHSLGFGPFVVGLFLFGVRSPPWFLVEVEVEWVVGLVLVGAIALAKQFWAAERGHSTCHKHRVEIE